MLLAVGALALGVAVGIALGVAWANRSKPREDASPVSMSLAALFLGWVSGFVTGTFLRSP